jgi:orotidine-5'-phosphate decarboxylase
VATVRAGLRVAADGKTTGPIVVNSSRAILYAGAGPDFASAARREALRTRDVLREAAAA